MPKPLGKQSSDFIVSLIAYFEAELDNNESSLLLTSVREKVAIALNIHVATTNKISAMTKVGVIPTSPKQKRIQKKSAVDVNDFTQCSIRNSVYYMYKKNFVN